MKLTPTKSDKKDKVGEGRAPDAVHMPWDAAMAGLASGGYDLAGYPKDARDSDLPAAQSPAPGTDPIDGKEIAAPGATLTNMAPVVGAIAAPGLPTTAGPDIKPTPAAEPKASDKKA